MESFTFHLQPMCHHKTEPPVRHTFSVRTTDTPWCDWNSFTLKVLYIGLMSARKHCVRDTFLFCGSCSHPLGLEDPTTREREEGQSRPGIWASGSQRSPTQRLSVISHRGGRSMLAPAVSFTQWGGRSMLIWSADVSQRSVHINTFTRSKWLGTQTEGHTSAYLRANDQPIKSIKKKKPEWLLSPSTCQRTK